MSVVDIIKRHEGTGPIKDGRFLAYQDTKKIWSCGFGRNLQGRGLSRLEAEYLLANDIADHKSYCMAYPWFSGLSEIRQAACVSLMFAGPGVFAQFRNFIAAMAAKNYEWAADEIDNSNYATQVGHRAQEIADMIKFDRWPA